MNNEFNQLHPIIQKWVYKQNWEDLRPIQKESISPIMEQNTDLVISASTASGKTEAAFLPACSSVIDNKDSFGIVYISPLKALINDQHRRLEELCEMTNINITAWHGDSLISKKKKALKDPQGILLITPESLESLLIRKAGWVQSAFSSLRYFIIDEYHAFLGTERGTQLQSLMYRIETLLEDGYKPIPRIALSATLGDMNSVIDSLRPNKELPCKLITSNSRSILKMQIKGYVEVESKEDKDEYTEKILSSDNQIALDLFNSLRGDSHLVFANSRQRTENFAALLNDLSNENIVPNEFFPHHGSLSKEIRSELESRLQKEELPTTAICTMTLELGIDIGKVKSVSQVTAPHSVASLRQRLGRSGRRGESAILRMYISEAELNSNSSIIDNLRLELLQSAAMIRLLIKDKWYEPADTHLFHFSTLLHQILAIIAQWGGVRADQLWHVLCNSGTFRKVTIEHFKSLLSHMGENNLITQLSSGELVLGLEGEQLVDHYSFYAVFKTPEEFRVLVNGKSIGTIPIDSLLIPEQHIVFSGRRWKVETIDVEKKVIDVSPAKGGKPPKFNGDGLSVHDKVRQEMYKIFVDEDYRIENNGSKIEFMDFTAKDLFLEGLKTFKDLGLKENRIISNSKHVFVIPWMGDKVVNTISVLLIFKGYKVSSFAGVIEIPNADIDEIKNILISLANDDSLCNSDLAKIVENKDIEKYDTYLPEDLLNKNYGARAFDIEGTKIWIKKELNKFLI